MLKIIPVKHQHVSAVIVSILTLVFSSKRRCAYIQPHKTAGRAVDLLKAREQFVVLNLVNTIF